METYSIYQLASDFFIFCRLMANKFVMRSRPFTSCRECIRSSSIGFFNDEHDKAKVKSKDRGDRKTSRNCFLAILRGERRRIYSGLDRSPLYVRDT